MASCHCNSLFTAHTPWTPKNIMTLKTIVTAMLSSCLRELGSCLGFAYGECDVEEPGKQQSDVFILGKVCFCYADELLKDVVLTDG
eukprot:4151050-Amphidinium_carterae.1